MSNVWPGRTVAALAGGLLLQTKPLLGALIGLLLWMFLLERRDPQPASADPAQPAPAVPPTPLEEAFAVLGVPADASDAEIEQAYRRAVAQAHPDRHAQRDEAAREASEQRTRELNAAYRHIRARQRAR